MAKTAAFVTAADVLARLLLCQLWYAAQELMKDAAQTGA